MDRKTKKAIQALTHRIQKLEQQLKGARRIEDEPGEVARLESDLQKAREKLHALREG